MSDNSETVKCRNCGLVLDVRPDEPPDKRTPCPSCGSTSRAFQVKATVKLGIHIAFKMKAKHKNARRPFVEERSGKELFNKTGEYTNRSIVIDRENDLYQEIITDSKTGEIIHNCLEPLSEHTNHGDAKNKQTFTTKNNLK